MQHSDVFKKPFSMDNDCYIWCNDGYHMCYTVIFNWESKEDLDKLKRIVNLMNGVKADPEGKAVEPFKFVGYNFDKNLIGAGDTEEEAKRPILLTRGWGPPYWQRRVRTFEQRSEKDPARLHEVDNIYVKGQTN